MLCYMKIRETARHRDPKIPNKRIGREIQSINLPTPPHIPRPHILPRHRLAKTDAIIILLPHLLMLITTIAREIPRARDPLSSVPDPERGTLHHAPRDPRSNPHHQRDELGGRAEQEGACPLQDGGCEVVAVDFGAVGGVWGIQIRG